MTGSDLLVIVPSRGRPDKAVELVNSFYDTIGDFVDLLIALDDDDPELENYNIDSLADGLVSVVVGPRLRLGPTLNKEAVQAAAEYPFVGFMGDDHRPRTLGWDAILCSALDEMGTGIVYGNDLFQGPNLPTAVFMTSNIIDALGYMVPPEQTHLYLDNAWLAWGQGAECLRYLPETIIEHVHPAAGKTEWDDRYAEVNSGEMYSADEAAFARYVATQLDADVAKIRALR
jgi:hypothetical protein